MGTQGWEHSTIQPRDCAWLRGDWRAAGIPGPAWRGEHLCALNVGQHVVKLNPPLCLWAGGSSDGARLESLASALAPLLG